MSNTIKANASNYPKVTFLGSTIEELKYNAKILGETYDYTKNRARYSSDLKWAKELYLTVFYRKSALFPNNPNPHCQMDVFSRMDSCEGCEKSIFRQLLDWSKSK